MVALFGKGEPLVASAAEEAKGELPLQMEGERAEGHAGIALYSVVADEQ